MKANDLQYVYKSGLSTMQCTWVAREIISYYTHNGSDVFGCLLDCSKASDKIRYESLFPKLLEKGMPLIIVWLC